MRTAAHPRTNRAVTAAAVTATPPRRIRGDSRGTAGRLSRATGRAAGTTGAGDTVLNSALSSATVGRAVGSWLRQRCATSTKAGGRDGGRLVVLDATSGHGRLWVSASTSVTRSAQTSPAGVALP